MNFEIHSDQLPLFVDGSGTVRIGASRILLDVVVAAYNSGDSPEEIVNQYPPLQLADVYDVIAYYIRYRTEVDSYLAKRENSAKRLRCQVEQIQGSQTELKERLLLRKQLLEANKDVEFAR